jgi:cyanophycin synthetase
MVRIFYYTNYHQIAISQMKVLELRVLRGPNFWSVKKYKLIQVLLDLEELEFLPTNKIPGFYERLTKLIPSLYNHHCSEEVPGGFFIRVKEGTWMGHVIEHIALEIQSLAGMKTGFGRTRGAGKEGMYYMVFEYCEEEAGLFTAKAAVQIAEALIEGKDYDLNKDIELLKHLWNTRKLGPSTYALVKEAANRGIPYIQLDDSSYIQLGYGAKQKRIQATIANTTSQIAVEIAGNKDETKRLLRGAYVPVPYGVVVTDVENLQSALEEVGFPLVIKPLDSNQGKGATTNIQSYEDAVKAFSIAKKISQKIIVEKQIPGYDFRALVINYKFVAAAMRKPASVAGDGVHTIQQLIQLINSDHNRGSGHECVLTAIKIDDDTRAILENNQYTLDTVLPEGEELFLKTTANISTGGTATDVTEEVHPVNAALFEQVARTIGLDICGIDIMASSLNIPLKESGGAIIEVNAAPGLRMHLNPTNGTPRNVAKPIIDMLFPHVKNSRIPIVAVTGTNGKTTTTRLIAQMAKKAGFFTGYTTTDGIYFNDDLILKGDCSGPVSAQFILKDKAVDFAVLETARGGLLRSGLAFDYCNSAVITNIAEDHLGLDGIDTLEKLAKVKGVVVETVIQNGYAVLNADDDLVYEMRNNVQCHIALFSLYAKNVRIEQHCADGGLAAFVEDGFVMIRKGNKLFPVDEVNNIPLTFSGKAECNVYNILGACLAAFTNQISINVIRQTLRSFVPSAENTPGRFNMFQFNHFTLMIDYAHNQHGVRALGKLVRAMKASVKVGVITGIGDRRSEDIIALGEEAARVFDKIVIRFDEDTRGRSQQEIEELLRKGIQNVSAQKPVICLSSEKESLEYLIANAVPDSLNIILIENIKEMVELVHYYLEEEKKTQQQLVVV